MLLAQPAGDSLGTHRLLVRRQHRAQELSEILQLPHVSRKGVTQKLIQRVWLHVPQPCRSAVPITREETLEERWDVFLPFSKGRDLDDNDRKPVEEILAKRHLL